MSEDAEMHEENDTTAAPHGVGAQLRQAREAKGLTIDQVAADTRISSRHIESIEAGDYDALPGRTYAIGFSRTLAKTVGLHEEDVVAMTRAELNERDGTEDRRATSGGKFEPGDPARAPGGRLVWFSIFAVLLLLAGIFFAARTLFMPTAELPSLTAQEEAEAEAQAERQAAAAQEEEEAVDPTGDVVFTAEGEVWVRFTDAQNRVLTEQTLSEGDSYTIPADADGPQIITGRPDLLAITIGGEDVPKLSEELETLTDVPVSAEALLARTSTPAPASIAEAEPAT